MNEKGVFPAIAGLPIILGLALFLILGAITFAFFKNVVFALAIGIVGGFLVYRSIPTLEKKYGQAIFVVGLFLLLLAMFVGIAQPFSIINSVPPVFTGQTTLFNLVQDFVNAIFTLAG